MQKIGNVTETADANGEFTDGRVAQGISPTILPAAIFNTWQRELVGIVEGGGLELNPRDDGQLIKAINSLFGKNIAVEIGANSLLLNLNSVSNGLDFIIQAGRGVINSTSGHITFLKPFPNSVISILPTKISDTNRYVTANNYNNAGFDIYGWVTGAAGNVDNFSYIAIGW